MRKLKSRLDIITGIMLKNKQIKNAAWGGAGTVLQNLFLSLSFIFMARFFAVDIFADFLILTALYQIISAFSLGLGQWYIRERFSNHTSNLIWKFLQSQLFFSIIFYLISIMLCTILYPKRSLWIANLVFALNVPMENFMYVVKNHYYAILRQKGFFILTILDTGLRLITVVIVSTLNLTLIELGICLFLARVIAVLIFSIVNSFSIVNPKFFHIYISWKDLTELIRKNLSFLIIGSISVVYWRLAGLIISRFFPAQALVRYEISFKVFLLFQLVPLIVGAALFPKLVEWIQAGALQKVKFTFKIIFIVLASFGLLSYGLIVAFSSFIIPTALGNNYPGAIGATQQMFLVMIVFPSAFIQANLLVALKKEKVDMWINLSSMTLFCLLIPLFLSVEHSIEGVYYSLAISWLAFHVLQDIVLVRYQWNRFSEPLAFYSISGIILIVFHYLLEKTNTWAAFLVLTSLVGVSLLISLKLIIQSNRPNKKVYVASKATPDIAAARQF